ncbi:MFS transporter [Oceanicoccus sp. KOV_DT_Chl]|uniref:MFS transporter n=1 Tax=Oceanicoccus sp. KOV_DT_Chl TaxID=1904639 RepID=UPI00135A3C58|nr:MFS transporter [Oceanicoccus sp. KOV_DT_Chl]
MWIVLFVVLLDIVGFGIIIPIFPFHAANLGAGPGMITLCLALYSGAVFIATPVLGRLSDRYGRKPIMAISLLGAVIGYVILAYAETIFMVAFSRVFSGVMAGNFSAAQAYVTDSTSDQDRAKYMGLLGAVMGLGFVIGPAIGSWLGGDSFTDANFVAPALVAAGLSLAAFFALIFFVKESLPKHVRQQVSTQKRPGLLQSIAAIRHRYLLVVLISCGSLYQLASGFYESIFPLWAEAFAIIEGPNGMLPMLLASGMSYVITSAVLIGPLTKRFSERHLMMVAALTMAATCYGITIAGNYGSALWVTLLMMLLSMSAGIIMICAQALVSRCAAEHERGMVLGVYSAAGMLARTITTALSGVMFGQLHYHSPYFAAAITAMVLCWMAFILVRFQPATGALLEDLPAN